MERNKLEESSEVIDKYKLLMKKESYEKKVDLEKKPYFVCLFDFMNERGAIVNEIELSGPSELGEIMDKLNINGKLKWENE